MTLDAAIRELMRDVVRDVVREELTALSEQWATATSRAEDRASSGYVSTKTAAAIAGVNEETVRVWVRRGDLQAHWAGRLLRIKRAELDRFMATGGEGEHDDFDVNEAARRILAKG